MNNIFTFFSTIHRTIFDPSFYIELGTRKFSSALKFILLLILFVSIFAATFHFSRISNRESGLPSVLPKIFVDVEFSKDGIVNHTGSPYLISQFLVQDLYNAASGLHYFRQSSFLVDSLIMVDGMDDNSVDTNSSVGITLKKSSIIVNYGNGFFYPVPYKSFIETDDSFFITKEIVESYLKKNSLLLIAAVTFIHAIIMVFNIIGSIFFLSVMAFIRSKRNGFTFWSIVKLAIFASTPLLIENFITVVVGTTYFVTWYIAVFFSVFALFRGMAAIISSRVEHVINDGGD